MTRRIMLGLLAGTPLSALVPACLPREVAETVEVVGPAGPRGWVLRGAMVDLEGHGAFKVSLFANDLLVYRYVIALFGDRRRRYSTVAVPMPGHARVEIEAIGCDNRLVVHEASIIRGLQGQLFSQRLEGFTFHDAFGVPTPLEETPLTHRSAQQDRKYIHRREGI
jgi:hypothetical protein